MKTLFNYYVNKTYESGDKKALPLSFIRKDFCNFTTVFPLP